MIRRVLFVLLTAALLAAPVSAHEKRLLVGYYPSWGPPAQLGDTPASYTHVVLAFARPDFAWNGRNWRGTGLEFAAPPDAVRRQIARLKAKGVRVLAAVGGEHYLNWKPLAAEAGRPDRIVAALNRFAGDMGLDGFDVDYEVEGTTPAVIAQYRAAIRGLGEAAGRGRLLTLAVWSTGADCVAATGGAACGGVSDTDGNNGRERLLFRDASVFARLSVVNVMSYDTGVDNFDPVAAWSLYRSLVPHTIAVNIGFEPAPEGWGNARLVVDNAHAVCAGAMVRADGLGRPVNKPYSVERSLRDGPLASTVNRRDGAMLWHILLNRNLPPCGPTPAASARDVERAARTLLDAPPRRR